MNEPDRQLERLIETYQEWALDLDYTPEELDGYLAAARRTEPASYMLDNGLIEVRVVELSDGPHAPSLSLTGYFVAKTGRLLCALSLFDGEIANITREGS